MEKLKEGAHYEVIPHTAVMDSRLSPKSLTLLMVLWVKTNNDTGMCHYSTETLCGLCGFKSKETFNNARKELVNAGWVSIKRGGVYKGKKQTSTYTVLPNNEVPDDCRRDYGVTTVAETTKTPKVVKPKDGRLRVAKQGDLEGIAKHFMKPERGGDLREVCDDETNAWYQKVYVEAVRLFETLPSDQLKTYKDLYNMAMHNLYSEMP